MPELVILLPTRDEEKGVVEVMGRIPTSEISEMGYECRVVVVDGHSSDDTCEVALRLGADLIRQNGSIGKGNGVREALGEIYRGSDDNADLLIMLDADATYSPEDLPRFIKELKDYDVVWGSRLRGNIEKDAMSITNKFGNRILSLVASILFLRRTTDLCTGYWGFRSGAIKKLSLTAKGFGLEADLFGSVVKSNFETKEIPIDYAHREGESTLRWYSDGPRILFMAIKKRFTR